MPDTVVGPDEEIPGPAFADMLDHEAELAAIIGRYGKETSRAGDSGVVRDL